MAKRIRLIIILIVAIGAVGAAVFFTMERRIVTLNDPDVVGNLPGNSLNGGYFCELGDKVYFANLNNNQTLYSMNPDESSFKQLGSMGVSELVGDDHYVYFFMDSRKFSGGGKGLGYVGNTYGVYRYGKKYGNTVLLDRCVPYGTQLCGSYLYYAGTTEESNGLFKLRIDKKERKKITDNLIMPYSFDGRYMYYAGAGEDPSLFSLNTAQQDALNKVLDGNVSMPLPIGNDIYYVDNLQNYKICRFNVYTRENVTIGTERVDSYNSDGNYIWYSVSAEGLPALKRMRMDGSDVQVISEGVYSNIHLTSRFVYFAPFSKEGPEFMYHVPIGSLGPVSRFNPPAGE